MLPDQILILTIAVYSVGFFTGQLYEFFKLDGTNHSRMRIGRLKRQLIVARTVHSSNRDGAPAFLSAPVERHHTLKDLS